MIIFYFNNFYNRFNPLNFQDIITTLSDIYLYISPYQKNLQNLIIFYILLHTLTYSYILLYPLKQIINKQYKIESKSQHNPNRYFRYSQLLILSYIYTIYYYSLQQNNINMIHYKVGKPITLTTSNLHSIKSLNYQISTVSNDHQMIRNYSALGNTMCKNLPKSEGYLDNILNEKEILKFGEKTQNDQERSEQNQKNYSNMKLKHKCHQFQKISLTSFKNNNSLYNLKNMSEQNLQSTTSIEEIYSPNNQSLNIVQQRKSPYEISFYKLTQENNPKLRNITPNSKVKTEQMITNQHKALDNVSNKQLSRVLKQNSNTRKNSDNTSEKQLFQILNPEKNKISLKDKCDTESFQGLNQPIKFSQFKKLHSWNNNNKQVHIQNSPTNFYEEKSFTQNKFILNKTSNYSSQNPKIEGNSKKYTSYFNFKKQIIHQINTINDFQIGRKIGCGKFGEVFIAKHLKTNMLFAIKKISKQKIKEFKMEKQLAQEIKIQYFLNHPNIVNLYTFFSDDQYIYLILEYMSEGTLFDDLQKRKEYPEYELARLLKPLVSAIKYLHNHHIAHRDIKPENILISNGVMKFCDFGWAGRVITPRKTYCGTLDYACPEILQRKQYGLGVDIWCLGILIYQLLTGRVPFEHKQRILSIKKIINVDKQKILYPSSMSKQARNIIENLLKKNPDQRLKINNILSHEFFNHSNDEQF